MWNLKKNAKRERLKDSSQQINFQQHPGEQQQQQRGDEEPKKKRKKEKRRRKRTNGETKEESVETPDEREEPEREREREREKKKRRRKAKKKKEKGGEKRGAKDLWARHVTSAERGLPIGRHLASDQWGGLPSPSPPPLSSHSAPTSSSSSSSYSSSSTPLSLLWLENQKTEPSKSQVEPHTVPARSKSVT